jgi:hypothetical protein
MIPAAPQQASAPLAPHFLHVHVAEIAPLVYVCNRKGRLPGAALFLGKMGKIQELSC